MGKVWMWGMGIALVLSTIATFTVVPSDARTPCYGGLFFLFFFFLMGVAAVISEDGIDFGSDEDSSEKDVTSNMRFANIETPLESSDDLGIEMSPLFRLRRGWPIVDGTQIVSDLSLGDKF